MIRPALKRLALLGKEVVALVMLALDALGTAMREQMRADFLIDAEFLQHGFDGAPQVAELEPRNGFLLLECPGNVTHCNGERGNYRAAPTVSRERRVRLPVELAQRLQLL